MRENHQHCAHSLWWGRKLILPRGHITNWDWEVLADHGNILWSCTSIQTFWNEVISDFFKVLFPAAARALVKKKKNPKQPKGPPQCMLVAYRKQPYSSSWLSYKDKQQKQNKKLSNILTNSSNPPSNALDKSEEKHIFTNIIVIFLCHSSSPTPVKVPLGKILNPESMHRSRVSV